MLPASYRSARALGLWARLESYSSPPGASTTAFVSMSKRAFFSRILILSGFLTTVFTSQVKAVNYVVVSTANSGSGSLEAAIDQANSNSGADTIVFNIANAGPVTIDLFSALPEITQTLTIDGTSEPGYAGTPLITIDTSNLPSWSRVHYCSGC